MMAQRPSPQSARAWYWRYLAAHTRDAILALGLGVVSVLSALPIFLLMRWTLDKAIPAHNFRGLFLAAGIILACRIAGSAFFWLIGRIVARHVRMIAANIRVDLLGSLFHWRWQDYGSLPDARAQSRMTTDVEAVELATQAIFMTLLPAVIPLAFYAALLFWFSWPLALGSAAVMAVVRVLTLAAQRNLASAIAAFQRSYETMYAGVSRTLQMIATARLQGSEAVELTAHRRRTLDLARAGANMTTAGIIHGQISGITTTAAIAFTLAAGGFAIASGHMSLGSLAAFLVGAGFASGIVNAIAGILPVLLAGNEALKRMLAFHNLATQEAERGGIPPDPASAIAFDGVSFSYAGRTILDAASFRAEPGKITAIAAPNGRGKTTILDLALGLHKPSAGGITIGGRDLRESDLLALRRISGVVPQHPAFFAGTIRENIVFGRPEAGDVDVERAVHLAGLDVLFRASGQSLDTAIGDRGQLLSGGERQRIAIARAIVHQPNLLLLDEPTNHLDAAAVRLFIERLLQIPARPTMLIATHDARILACADTIYDLADGKLVARQAKPMTSDAA